MKAYVLHGIGDYQYEEVQKPSPAPGTVLVKVGAAGICGSDIPRIYKTGAYSHPLIPGHEFAGEVTEVGQKASASLLGKRVGVFPLIPCMECAQCKEKQYEMCSHYSYLGSRTDGGFAEYVQVPEWNLLPLPDNVTMEQAAMLEPMAVAVHAIRRAKVNPRQTIAVCGMGTIGLFVVMFLKEMGCEKVFAAGNKDFQKNLAKSFGIGENAYCDIRQNSFSHWLKERTDSRGADVFFDCVGKNEVLGTGVESLAPKGTLLLVGNPASDVSMEKSLYWKILRSQLQLLGTWNSSFTHERTDDWNYVLERLALGRIHPEEVITHRFSMEDFMEGFAIMRDKSQAYVKMMMLAKESC